MRNTVPILLLPALFALLSGVPAGAQETPSFTLRQAVALSLDKNPDRRIAASDVTSAQIGAKAARTALLPNLSFSEAITRGDDPVYAFGTQLRQQRFQQSDFALNNLNRPTPINDFTTRFSGSWMGFDSWRTELQIRRSDLLTKSAEASAGRSDQEIVHRVVASYEHVLFASRYVELARHQAQTAQSVLDASQSRVQAGVAVDADQLTAATNLALREQESIEAEGNLATAWAELERAIGAPIREDQRQLQTLAEKHFDPPAIQEAVSVALRSRPDRESLIEQLRAQRAGVAAARAGFGPSIGTFGSWETDRQSFAGDGGNNWMAGAELRVDLLPAARRDELAAAKATLQRTEAASDAADQQIRLEVVRAWYAHQAASRMLDVARASVAQSDESLRILRDRYDAGLVTVTELLRAEDAQRQSATSYWQAVFRNAVSYADLEFAMGTLNASNAGDLE
jgi:outer membrane protein TolC